MKIYGVPYKTYCVYFRHSNSRSHLHSDLPQVHYPPTFTIKRTPGFGIPVVEGMTLSLQCLVDVYPQTFGSWIKDEEPAATSGGGASSSSNNGTIVFDEIRPEDSGWFQGPDLMLSFDLTIVEPLEKIVIFPEKIYPFS